MIMNSVFDVTNINPTPNKVATIDSRTPITAPPTTANAILRPLANA